MNIAYLIIGGFVGLVGLFLTGGAWFMAFEHHILSLHSAYVGPILVAVGVLRIVSTSAAIRANFMLRIAAIGVGFLLGAVNYYLIKFTVPFLTSSTLTTH